MVNLSPGFSEESQGVSSREVIYGLVRVIVAGFHEVKAERRLAGDVRRE